MQQYPVFTQATEYKIFSLVRETSHSRRATLLMIAIGTVCVWTGSEFGLEAVEGDPATSRCNYCVHL